MKKILVPTDFSDNSRHALNVAAAIAAKAGSRIEILHTNTAIAYAPPLPEYYTPANFDTAEYYETAANELFNMKSALLDEKNNKDLEIITRVEEGFLHTSIRGVANKDTADLVVMGTKGATGAVEFFVGSNTEKVIRTAHCPVLAVPETSGEFNPKVLVLSSTLRHDQLPAFHKVAEWQKVFPFEVRVLYLNNPAGFDSSHDIEKVAHDFCSQAGIKNATVFISGNTFNEASSILQFADEQSADLIAMATHQRQGLSHLLFGSLTEDTANHSDIPVLSIPI